MEKNMKKQNDKKAEKGMNRTEFAQEYSLETNKQNSIAHSYLPISIVIYGHI